VKAERGQPGLAVPLGNGVVACWVFTRYGKTGKGLGVVEALDTPPAPLFLQE
jgi:hypothetical protein